MARSCEVCAALGSGAHGGVSGKIRRLLIGERIVALCGKHAEQASVAELRGLTELRALFPEPNGRRSLVPRRSPLDRRVFPARPEGRRGNDGRRLADRK